jgi:hypothetical protein
MAFDPKETLLKGMAIVESVLQPHGFKFMLGNVGQGSGGHFASGEFSRDDRRLELHFRHSLGLVTYHIGKHTLDHETYLRYLGKWQQRKYPGFSDDPLDGFRHLAHDLQTFCMDFVSGPGDEFCTVALEHVRNPNKFKGLHIL